VRSRSCWRQCPWREEHRGPGWSFGGLCCIAAAFAFSSASMIAAACDALGDQAFSAPASSAALRAVFLLLTAPFVPRSAAGSLG